MGRKQFLYCCGLVWESALLGWVLFQVASERKAMMAMMTLATTPAAEWAMMLNAIQQMDARAA